MSEFKVLNIQSFTPHLELYNLISTTLQSKSVAASTEFSSLLIESIFLQMYATLEEALILECKNALIPKKASISRFETALFELGYFTDVGSWLLLVEVSKIRNCILHGNGLLTEDIYADLTKIAMNKLNMQAKINVIELKKEDSALYSKVKINKSFLTFYYELIVEFINAQK